MQTKNQKREKVLKKLMAELEFEKKFRSSFQETVAYIIQPSARQQYLETQVVALTRKLNGDKK